MDVPQEVVLKACLPNGEDTVKKVFFFEEEEKNITSVAQNFMLFPLSDPEGVRQVLWR